MLFVVPNPGPPMMDVMLSLSCCVVSFVGRWSVADAVAMDDDDDAMEGLDCRIACARSVRAQCSYGTVGQSALCIEPCVYVSCRAQLVIPL